MTSPDIKVRPICKSILVRKCTQGEFKDGHYVIGDIAIPQRSSDDTNFAEILDVSDDCKTFTKDMIGSFLRLNGWLPQYIRRVGDDTWTVRERIMQHNGFVAAIFTNG